MKIEVIENITQLLLYLHIFLNPIAFRFIHSKYLKSRILTKSISLYFLLSECSKVQYHFSRKKLMHVLPQIMQ